jgi:DNA-binding transcriptional MerR regulator/methylmalonyl-CoA mutase cobalamin-binding subunit
MTLHTIGVVEAITGLSKDTLRKWESRYRFPMPSRDNLGIRLYSDEDIEKLRLIKALINRGQKINKISKLSYESLKSLLEPTPNDYPLLQESFSFLLNLSKTGDAVAIRLRLVGLLEKMGLKDFAINFIAPFIVEIGAAWHRGDLSIAQEHLCSAQIIRVLSEANALIVVDKNAIKVLLTTPPQELHTIGLKLVEALVLVSGASPLCLDAQTPIDQILLMAKNAKVRAVALSVSAAFPLRHFRKYIETLECALDPDIEIWVGGAGAKGINKDSRVRQISLEGIEGEISRLKFLGLDSTL